MKTLLLAGVLFVSGLFTSAYATTTCDLTSGTSTANQQAALTAAAANSCTIGGNVPDGHTVFYQAGSFSITSQITLGCPNQSAGVLVTGPTPSNVGTSWPLTYTTTLTSSVGNNWAFSGPACSNGTTFRYLNYDGAQPSGGGGGFLFTAAGMNNLSVHHNYFHGVSAIQTTTQSADTFIYNGSGVLAATHTQNWDIGWNIFGASGDCGGQASSGNQGLMNLYGGGNFCSSGGYGPPTGTTTCLYQGAQDITHGGGSCGGIGLNNNYDGMVIHNNVFNALEQPLKLYEAPTPNKWSSTGLVVQYNDMAGTHRIGNEAQSSITAGTHYKWDSNDWHDPIKPNAGQWALSLPLDTADDTNNLLIANVAVSNDKNGQSGFYAGDCIEFWGNGTSANNVCQGKFNGGIFYGFGSTPRSIVNNTIQLTGNSNFIVNEEGTSPAPTQSGNVTSNTVTTFTSAAPTIAPSLGTQNFPLTVTLSDAGLTSGSQPLGNTGIWYTTDGSTPVPASGTAKRLDSGGTFTLASAATVKAVGMWGALNQPTSYPAGYGFVPSNMVSVTYSGGSTPTIVSGYLSTTPTNGINTAVVGGTIQFGPIANYSNGSNNVPIAANLCTWDTTDHTLGTVGATTGLFTGVASTGTGVVSVKATCSGVLFSQWDVSVSAPVGPSLTGLTTSPSAIYSTTNTSLSAVGTFSDGSVGAATGTWASSNTNVAQVDQSGNVTPHGMGTTYVSVTNGSLSATSAVIVPPSVLYDNPVQTTSFPYSNSNFGCFVFQKLPTGNYSLVVNADGSFTVTPQ